MHVLYQLTHEQYLTYIIYTIYACSNIIPPFMNVNLKPDGVRTASLNVFVDSDRCFYFLSESELAQFSTVCKQIGLPVREFLNEARIDHVPHVIPRSTY